MRGILESPGDPLSGEKAQVALTELIPGGSCILLRAGQGLQFLSLC